jgi:hypothetical protein
MDGHEPGTYVRTNGCRHLRAAKQRTGAPIGRHLAYDQQLSIVQHPPGLVDAGGDRLGNVDETRLDDSPISPLTYNSGFGPRTRDETQPRHHQRLTSTSLPGDYRQARTRLEHGVADDAQPDDPQFDQHQLLRCS